MTRLAWFFTLAPPLAIAILMALKSAGVWPPSKIAGAIVATAGFGLLTLARLELGRAFSLAPAAKVLVTTGLYARIRHPIYVFSALGLAGLVLYFDFLPLALLLVVIIPLQIVRARREEQVLEEKFGDAYRRYRARTWF